MKRYTMITSGLLLLLTVIGIVQPASAQQSHRWLADPQLLTTARMIGGDGRPFGETPNSVADIDLIDAHTGWAAAYGGLLRFDGRFWRPAVGFGSGTGIAAIDLGSRTNGWAVGGSYVAGAPTTLFLTRYDSNQWSAVHQIVRQDGSTGVQSGYLTDVTTLPDGTAYAVGTAYDQVAPGNYRERPLVIFFDGNVWRDQTPDQWRDGTFTRLSMISPTEGWFVGRLGRPGGTDTEAVRPAIVHLKDGAWIEQPLPELPFTGQPFNMSLVTMQSANSGYAIFYDLGTRCPVTSLLRYNSGTWSVVPRSDYGNDSILTLAIVPGTNHGWATQLGCQGRSPTIPNRRLRFDNGAFLPDTTGTQLAPSVYGLLNDEVQWAAIGGSMLRYSGETLPTQALPPGVEADAMYFATTGHYIVEQAFIDYYRMHGLEFGDRGVSERESLALFGYPVSESFQEINPETGEVLTVQYFERARFEYHAANPDPYKVLLGRLGAHSLIRLGRNPANAPAPEDRPQGCATFNETPYVLCAPFEDFWNRSGGLPVFGFPLTNPAPEQSVTDGNTYQTQWFERERMEHHPEHSGTPYEILLGLLGSEELRMRGYMQ